VWANDGGVPGRNDPDFFDVAFGPNADVARADVRQAIQDWEQVIVNFNFDLPGAAPEYLNMFELSVQAKNLGSTLDQIDLGGRDTIYDRFGNDLTGRPPGGYPPVLQFGKPVLANINVDGMGGQDLLIAGASASTLQGTGADILIGGQTVDDHNLAALEFTL